MKKLFLIPLSILLTSVCYADADQEKTELEQTILLPIKTYFYPSDSITKKVSDKLIVEQRGRSQHFTNEQADKLGEVFYVQYEKEAHMLKFKEQEKRIMALWKPIDKTPKKDSVFYSSVYAAVTEKAGTSFDYANLVKVSFEFYRLNEEAKDHEFNFIGAYYISAKSDSGEYNFILIKGKSKAVFAVDAVENKIKKLSASFNNIFDREVDTRGDINLSKEQSHELTQWFKTSDGYYNVHYVNKDTEWIINKQYSEKIKESTEATDTAKRSVYEVLQMYIFNQWLEYTEFATMKYHNETKVPYKRDTNGNIKDKKKSKCEGCSVS